MKLRLITNKTTIRISETEWVKLKKTSLLSEEFRLSKTKTWFVSLRLSDLNAYEETAEGFSISIDEADFNRQKTKKNQAWQLAVGSDFFIEVEVDLKKTADFLKEFKAGV